MKQNTVREFPSFLGFDSRKGNRYAVILAGGEGSRLKSLTRAIAGDERPKQFCPILNDETLLTVTQKRAALKIRPENTFYSLTRAHEFYFTPLLAGVAKHQQIVQPENKGTAPAILYSLLRLAKVDPAATVVFFPSDHYFSDDRAFMETTETAFKTVDINPGSIVLLGIEPAKAETSYGWIEPAQSLFGDLSRAVSRVKMFWEKPAPDVANELMMRGCLWNSFVMVGKVQTFIDLFQKHLPDLLNMFTACAKTFGTADESGAIRSIYDWIGEINFSSEVLEKCTDELFVLRVGDVGWSDWGEPHRVLDTLTGIGVRAKWMQAMAA